MSIPKKIHQIWVGDKRIPKHIKEFMAEIKDSHPEYEYFFWTDQNVPEMPRKLKSIYDSIVHPAQKADLLRVYVLYLYGGICLDADYKLLTHLDDLDCFDNRDAYIVYQKHQTVEDFYCSIQISGERSDFIKFMMSKIGYEGIWLGPHWYAECIYEYVGLNKYCNYQDILNRCESYNLGHIEWEHIDKNIVNHNFLASWYPNSEWKKKFDTDNYD